MTTKLHALVLSVLLLIFTAAPASAFTVDGMAMTDDVLFEWDYKTVGADLLYGNPTIIDGSLVFLPSTFVAKDPGGFSSPDQVNGVVDIRITAKEGFLQSLNVKENGDAIITTGMNTSGSATWALGTFINGFSGILTFDTLTETSLWSTEHDRDLSEDAPVSLILTVENTLVANHNVDGTALIQKKGIIITTTAVPVPAAVWMFGSVLATLGLFRRQAKAK